MTATKEKNDRVVKLGMFSKEYEYRRTEVISAEIKEITPKEAEQFLSTNEGNRNISNAKAQEYSRYMREGSWRTTGQGLTFSEDGNLLDGQHRLVAVALYGKPVTFLVVTLRPIDGKGPLTATALPLDRGKMRSISDLTGIPKKHIEIARTLIRDISVDGAKKSQDPEIVARVFSDLEESIVYVNTKCSTASKTFSQASIRSCIALRCAQGYDFTDEYHAIITQNYAGLGQSWISWMRKMFEIQTHDKWSRREMMAYTWALTKPDRDFSKNLQVQNKEKRIEEMQAVLYEFCFSSLAKTAP